MGARRRSRPGGRAAPKASLASTRTVCTTRAADSGIGATGRRSLRGRRSTSTGARATTTQVRPSPTWRVTKGPASRPTAPTPRPSTATAHATARARAGGWASTKGTQRATRRRTARRCSRTTSTTTVATTHPRWAAPCRTVATATCPVRVSAASGVVSGGARCQRSRSGSGAWSICHSNSTPSRDSAGPASDSDRNGC